MNRKFYKFFVIFGILTVLLVIPVFWFFYKVNNNLIVDYLSVGQGDSELVKTPFGQNILIDGGPDNSVLSQLGQNLAFWDRKIDLMILTHPHEDHVTGLIDVLKRYRVEKILYTGVAYDSPNYYAWLALVKNEKIPLLIIDHPETINLGADCQLRILYPLASLAGQVPPDMNNSSIVAKLIYNKTNFLFMGDAGKEVETKILKSDLSAQVLKVGHHGSDTATSQEFLDAVKPTIAIIEVGAGNKYGLPSERTINILQRNGVSIYRTDQYGTVKIDSDGTNIIREE
jgi:competence protein ComEC